MGKAPRPYVVTRHDPVEQIDDNLWAVNGDVPGMPTAAGMERRMSIIKLGDGRLVFHNAIPLDEQALAQVTAWGKPSILIVPMQFHATDAAGFREKLGVKVFTSKVALDKVRSIVAVDGILEELPVDPSLKCEPLAGTRLGEAAYVVKSGARASLLFCDAIHDSRPGRGFHGFMFRLMGFTGQEPKMPPFYKLRMVSDKKALKADLLRLAETPGLARLVPSHGLIVENDPAGALRRAAER